MKNVEQSTATSKRSRGEASTATLTSNAMPVAEETFEDLTIVVDPSGGADNADPTVTPPFSLHAMMESFVTTQATHGQLLDELFTEVASLRADFMEYRSAFPPPPPSDDRFCLWQFITKRGSGFLYLGGVKFLYLGGV